LEAQLQLFQARLFAPHEAFGYLFDGRHNSVTQVGLEAGSFEEIMSLRIGIAGKWRQKDRSEIAENTRERKRLEAEIATQNKEATALNVTSGN